MKSLLLQARSCATLETRLVWRIWLFLTNWVLVFFVEFDSFNQKFSCKHLTNIKDALRPLQHWFPFHVAQIYTNRIVTQKQTFLIFILKDTNHTKVNPTGFLILVCAGARDSNSFFLNYYRSSLILNEFKLNHLFYFLTQDLKFPRMYNHLMLSLTHLLLKSKLLANIGLLQILYVGICVYIYINGLNCSHTHSIMQFTVIRQL